MKKPLLLILLFVQFASINSNAQSSIIADPAIGLLNITDLSGNSIPANNFTIHTTGKLILPVYNFSQDKYLPAGSGRIIISLGTNMTLDPTFDLSSAALSNYFSWTSSIVNGQVIITGNLIADFPPDQYTETSFQVIGSSTCTSNISANFKVTNHNTAVMLSDEDLNNNWTSLQYTINGLLADADAGTVTIDGNTGGIAVMNVLLNDFANCSPADLVNVRISEVSATHPGITLNITNVIVAAGTPTGTYNLTYKICDMLNASNCTQGIVTVKVINTNVNTQVTTFPNPYTNVINFRILSPITGKANLVLYDITGRQIAMIPNTIVEAGIEKIITYPVNPMYRSCMVYKIIIGTNTFAGKLVPAY